MKKAPNKILILSLGVFMVFFVKALLNVVADIDVEAGKNKAADVVASLETSTPYPTVDFTLFEKIRSRNPFLSAEVAPASGAARPAALPSLGKNEIRDEASGAVFKFIGILNDGETRSALFQRMDPPPPGERKSFFLREGDAVGGGLKIREIGDKGLMIVDDDRALEFRLFHLELEVVNQSAKEAASQGKRDAK